MEKITSLFLMVSLVIGTLGFVAANEDDGSAPDSSIVASTYTTDYNVNDTNVSVNCVKWHDGCNTCNVVDGEITSCTMMYCESYSEPKCLGESGEPDPLNGNYNGSDSMNPTDGESYTPKAKKVGFFANQIFRINLAFTFNKEKKIEKTLEMAEKRLAEAELLAEENPEAYEKVQERYDNLVARAEEILAKIESGAAGSNQSLTHMEKIARIQSRFENHRDHADEIYTRALERLDSNNASEEKIERFEKFYERALERNEALEEKIIEKRNNALRKHKALSEMSEEELAILVKDIDVSEGLTGAQKARVENAKTRLNRIDASGAHIPTATRERLMNDNSAGNSLPIDGPGGIRPSLRCVGNNGKIDLSAGEKCCNGLIAEETTCDNDGSNCVGSKQVCKRSSSVNSTLSSTGAAY
jgi:hypothetical protein